MEGVSANVRSPVAAVASAPVVANMAAAVAQINSATKSKLRNLLS